MRYEMTIGVSTHGTRGKWLRDMINTLFYYNHLPFGLIVVDNASTDSTAEYLKRLSRKMECRVIRNNTNLDDTFAMNQILDDTNTPYLLKVDSDTLFVGERSVERVLILLKDKGVSIAGPFWDLSLSRRKEIEHWSYATSLRRDFNRADKAVKSFNQHFEVTMRLPRGNFMLMRVSHVKEVGGFDLRYPHNAMEYSLVARLIEAGYDYVEYNDSYVIHKPDDLMRTNSRKIVPDLLAQ